MVLRQDDVLMNLKEEEHRPEIGEHRGEPCEFMEGSGLQVRLRVSHAACTRYAGQSRQGSFSVGLRRHALGALQLLGEDRHAEIARLHALDDAELQHLHDLFHRRPRFEGGFDVAARARRVHVRVGGIERDAEQFQQF